MITNNHSWSLGLGPNKSLAPTGLLFLPFPVTRAAETPTQENRAYSIHTLGISHLAPASWTAVALYSFPIAHRPFCRRSFFALSSLWSFPSFGSFLGHCVLGIWSFRLFSPRE